METENKRELWRNLKRSWKFARKHKKSFLLYASATLILSGIGAITPMISAQLLLRLTGGLWTQLLIVAAIRFAIEVTRNIGRYLGNKIGQIFFRETVLDLQLAVAEETLKLETNEIDTHSSGVFIERLNKDTNDIVNIFSDLNDAIMDIVANIGVLVMIFTVSKIMFFCLVIGTILLFILERIRLSKFFTMDKKIRKLQEKNTGIVTELIRGIRDIKVLNAGSTFMKKMREQISTANQGRYQMTEINRKYRLLIGSLHDLLDLIFIGLGVYLVTHNLLTTASFLILYTYSSRVYNLLQFFAVVVERLKNFNLSASRVFEIIGNDKFKKETFGTKQLSKANGNFEFDHVHFSYRDGQEILKDISFQIHANETVSFVGKSGGGKTTIFNLLTKLYQATGGHIRIDGIDIEELDQDSIRNNMSIITQNPYIFNFSIRENLKLAQDSVSDEEMIEVCKTACFHEFVMSLPEGYDTIVGEGGITLSGGQRQRLAIARALLRKTEIILLDEATSALDNETQKNIQLAIGNMKGEYTILIIAHRLSTVIDSDRIILLEEGQIIATGTHHKLLEESLFYQRLYEKELQ